MSVPLTKFDQPTITETVRQLADHMPTGEVWGAKLEAETVLNTLMFGVAKPFNITQGRISDLANDFDIDQTTELITDWETSVGLPDDCFGIVNDLDERRALVKERFARTPIVTLAEQQAFIDEIFPDEGIVLVPGTEFFQDFEFSFGMSFSGNLNTRFIIVALIPSQEPFFELEFEITFTGGAIIENLECILRKISPANVLPLIIEEEPT